MSIFFDFHVPEHGRRFRRAVEQDKHDVQALVNPEERCKLFYDQENIGSLIELSTLSICMINDERDVVGFMALCDHPNVPTVAPADWEQWLVNMFHQVHIPRQILFVHFMCCLPSVEAVFLEEAFAAVFTNDVYLNQIALVIPPRCPYSLITRYTYSNMMNYTKIWSYDEFREKQHCLMLAPRKFFCPKLKIRRAVEEDNEEIVSILDAKSPELRKFYGEYYASEIVARETDRIVIVAQLQDQAAGVMCLNSNVNCNNLQRLYELNALHGLVKASAYEKEVYKRQNQLLKEFGDPIAHGNYSPFHAHDKKPKGLSSTLVHITSSSKILKERRETGISRVNFRRRLSQRPIALNQSMVSEDFSDMLRTSNASQMFDTSVTHLLDDDPFDYEIVNIDKSLLLLPMSSYDFNDSKSDFISKPRRKSEKQKSLVKLMANQEPEYEGLPNAFAIELYGLRGDIDDRRGFDLLQASFDCMKNFEYCIIRVPTTEQSFYLLEHFTYIPTKSNNDSKYALYVTHRNTINDRIRVRRAEFPDLPSITMLLKDLDVKETIWTVQHCMDEAIDERAYIFTSGNSIVGLAIIETPSPKDMSHLMNLRARFNMDPFFNRLYYDSPSSMNNGVSAIKSVFVYSVFQPHFRFFARELMRQSGRTGLVWLTAYRNKQIVTKANSMASCMVPIMPRKRAVFPRSHELRTKGKKSKNLVTHHMPFCLWFLSKRHTSITRVPVNTRLVVVGSSRTAMAFLNSLLFRDSSTYLTFANVTLVSRHGLPYLRRRNIPAEMMFRKFRTNSDLYFKCTPYQYYVDIVKGNMVEINKQDKYLVLENGFKVFYDMLFLMFGQQYQHPEYMSHLFDKQEIFQGDQSEYVRLDIPRHMDLEPCLVDYDTPDNVFIINTLLEAAKALNYTVKTVEWLCAGAKVIVYGNTIEAYCCLSALLELKIPAENIVFVEPFPSEDEKKTRVEPFCNVYVDEAIRNVIAKLDITVYRSYYFRCWQCTMYNMASQIHFISYFETLALDCHAFFYYGKRGISPSAFYAVNKCGLAYNGGVLIDHKFRTQVPSIYAAGPATRYFAKYFAPYRRHEFFNSHDIGKMLGCQIRDELDPYVKVIDYSAKHLNVGDNRLSFDAQYHGSHPPSDQPSVGEDGPNKKTAEWCLPELKKPKVIHCMMPGNLQYLEVRSAGFKTPHPYVQLSLNYNGVIMETFKNGYFKLHMTSDSVVDGITCLTARRQTLEYLPRLFGLSAVTLNNVHLRYTLKRMDDFFEFFSAPWASYIQHEMFNELMATVKEVVPKNQLEGKTIEESLRLVAENIENNPDEEIKNESRIDKIRSNFSKSPHFAAITEYIIEWLAENEDLMPGFLQRRHVVEYSYDLALHPAFKRRKLNSKDIAKYMN